MYCTFKFILQKNIKLIGKDVKVFQVTFLLCHVQYTVLVLVQTACYKVYF